MLLATSEAQGADLAARQASLAAKGVRAELLDHGQLLHREPALQGSSVHSGLLVPADAQLVSTCDGRPACNSIHSCTLHFLSVSGSVVEWFTVALTEPNQ